MHLADSVLKSGDLFKSDIKLNIPESSICGFCN